LYEEEGREGGTELAKERARAAGKSTIQEDVVSVECDEKTRSTIRFRAGDGRCICNKYWRVWIG